jgi:hypothetical protein
MTVGPVKAVSEMEVPGWNEELDDKLFKLKAPAGHREEKD